MAYKLRQRQGQKQIARYKLVAGGASILGLFAYITFVINTANVEESKANVRDFMDNDPINNGTVVLAYGWDNDSPLNSETGDSAYSIGGGICMDGTPDNTKGLSASPKMKAIDLKIKPNDGLNADGLDISIDYKRTEETGDFYTRGNSFNFGMKDGMLWIKYKITNPAGKTSMVEETTSYKIPEDGQFRNYRFIYTPVTGKGEIMVNRATVWTHQSPSQCRLTWKTAEDIVIGHNMNGNGKFTPIFDNLIVRKTGTANNSPIELLGFEANMNGNQIQLNWYTGKEIGTEYYKIERSIDTKNFEEIGRVKAAGNSVELKEYSLTVNDAAVGIYYYRLGLTNCTAKSIWVPVIAFRVRPEMIGQPANPVASTSPILPK